MKFTLLGYLDTEDIPDDEVCTKCGLVGGCPCCLGFKLLTRKLK